MRRTTILFSRRAPIASCTLFLVVAAAFAMLFCGGCGTSQTLPPPEPDSSPKAGKDAPKPANNQEPYTLGEVKWSFWPDGVSLRIKSGTRLNEFEGKSHTVSVCVYQLSNANIFQNLSKQKDGVITLLNCKSFDKSVASFNRAIVEPGKTVDLVLDRAEGAQFVGLAAGYFELKPDKSVKLVEIPVDVVEKGVFTTDTYRRPAPLNLDLLLGPQYIENVEKRSVAK